MNQQILLLLIAGLGATLAGLATWAWNYTHRRIGEAHRKIDEVSKDSTGQVEKLRELMDQLAEKVLTRSAQDRDRFEELNHTVARLETQVSRAVSDIVDDKKVRDKIDSTIMEKLDALLERRSQRVPTKHHRREEDGKG